MVLPFVWRQAERPRPPEPEPEAVAIEPAPPLGFNVAAFGATLGPELSRSAGVRVAVRPIETDGGQRDPQAMLVLARLPLKDGSLLFTLDRAGGSALLDRMFGSRPRDACPPLDRLPPASGSWLAFARLLSSCCQQAAAGSCTATAPLVIPSRPMPPEPEQINGHLPPVAFALDVDGVPGTLLVHLILPAAERGAIRSGADAGGPTPADLDDWRERATALTLALDLPVTMRLADKRLPMAQVAALKPGDVIPIDPPRLVSLMVAGRRFAQLPVDGLGGLRNAPRDKDKR